MRDGQQRVVQAEARRGPARLRLEVAVALREAERVRDARVRRRGAAAAPAARRVGGARRAERGAVGGPRVGDGAEEEVDRERRGGGGGGGRHFATVPEPSLCEVCVRSNSQQRGLKRLRRHQVFLNVFSGHKTTLCRLMGLHEATHSEATAHPGTGAHQPDAHAPTRGACRWLSSASRWDMQWPSGDRTPHATTPPWRSLSRAASLERLQGLIDNQPAVVTPGPLTARTGGLPNQRARHPNRTH